MSSDESPRPIVVVLPRSLYEAMAELAAPDDVPRCISQQRRPTCSPTGGHSAASSSPSCAPSCSASPRPSAASPPGRSLPLRGGEWHTAGTPPCQKWHGGGSFGAPWRPIVTTWCQSSRRSAVAPTWRLLRLAAVARTIAGMCQDMLRTIAPSPAGRATAPRVLPAPPLVAQLRHHFLRHLAPCHLRVEHAVNRRARQADVDVADRHPAAAGRRPARRRFALRPSTRARCG